MKDSLKSKTLSILIICNNKDSEVWKKALTAKLPDETIEIFPEVEDPNKVDFIVCWKPGENVFEQFSNAKVIQSLGAGIDHISTTNTVKEDCLVSRIIDPTLSEDMWEFVLAAVLAHMKQFPIYAHQQLKKNWQPHSYQVIKTTTIAILGLGVIGIYVAEKFAQIGFTVKGWANSRKVIPGVKSYKGREELSACLNNSDFLINILPLTDATRGILNEANLKSLKSGACLINVGRGAHLMEADLTKLLDESVLSGAVLDVFATEPLAVDHPFWQHPKIRITPHVASLTNVTTAVNQVVENYLRFKENKPLLNIVSMEKGY